MYDPRDMYELAAEDALDRQERYSRPRRRPNIDCADGFCGAADCLTCHPEGEKLEPDDEPIDDDDENDAP
jgi:hypothetical protein